MARQKVQIRARPGEPLFEEQERGHGGLSASVLVSNRTSEISAGIQTIATTLLMHLGMPALHYRRAYSPGALASPVPGDVNPFKTGDGEYIGEKTSSARINA